MFREAFLLEVTRNLKSYDFHYNNPDLNDYQNNTKNNMLDSIKLICDDRIIFECSQVQTVSNHPKMKHSDTVNAGNFQVNCFVDQRKYNTPIHGIINAKDITNQTIDKWSMQWDNGVYIGRWLIHSSYYNPIGKDTKGYSGGCFVMSTDKMLELNRVLIGHGINPGDVISGVLIESGG